MIDKEGLKRNQEAFESLRKNSPQLILSSELKKEWDKFLSIFSEDKIRNLKINEYVLDRNNPEGSFCYWVEVRLNELGNMHGSYALKFGLYLSKETRDFIPTKKFGGDKKNKEKAFDKIKQSLIDLLVAGKNDDIEKIKNNPLSVMFKGKILFLYYPQKFINVLSDRHLNYFLRELEIPFSENSNAVDKRTTLIYFKNSDPIMKRWTNQEFESFLYKFYGPPKDIDYSGKELDNAKDIKEQEEIRKKTRDISKEVKIRYLNSMQPTFDLSENVKGKSYKRDNIAISYLKEIRGYKCQLCGFSILKKKGGLYIEASHIIPKHKKGSELPENILILCPNHHKEFDWGNKKIIEKTKDKIIFELNGNRYEISLELK